MKLRNSNSRKCFAGVGEEELEKITEKMTYTNSNCSAVALGHFSSRKYTYVDVSGKIERFYNV